MAPRRCYWAAAAASETRGSYGGSENPFLYFSIVSDTVTGSTMLKFIWGRGQGPTAERVKLQKELFNFSKNVTYGFPSKPGDALADVNEDFTSLQNLSDIVCWNGSEAKVQARCTDNLTMRKGLAVQLNINSSTNSTDSAEN